MSTSLAFYRRLGLAIPDSADVEPHVEVRLPGGLRLLFDTIGTIRSFDPGWEPPTGGHRVALGFACSSPSEVDGMHADLVAAGAREPSGPLRRLWGQRYATVLDPDGNPVDLFAPLG